MPRAWKAAALLSTVLLRLPELWSELAQDLGFRVWGLGFRVWGLGLRI